MSNYKGLLDLYTKEKAHHLIKVEQLSRDKYLDRIAKTRGKTPLFLADTPLRRGGEENSRIRFGIQ